MTDKVEFPGGWAKLREPEDVTELQRRPLVKMQRVLAASEVGDVLQQRAEMGEKPDEDEIKALLKPVLANDEWELLDDAADLLICALVEEWSFEDKPITVEEVKRLPGRAYRALRDECDPLLDAVLGNPTESEITDHGSKQTPGSD
jgi:hypothetical protein